MNGRFIYLDWPGWCTYVEFLSRLGESLSFRGVDDVDQTVAIGIVVLPELSGWLVTSKIIGLEANLVDDQLLGVRVDSRKRYSNLKRQTNT